MENHLFQFISENDIYSKLNAVKCAFRYSKNFFFFQTECNFLDNIVGVIYHFTGVYYGLYLNLSYLFILTCKYKNMMKDFFASQD